MATTIYFVKATYDDNIYKLSDFYTGTAYKQIANKSINVDMAFNDGPTTLDTHIRILPDATDIRDHTHIIVPSKKKIYRIDSIDEPNYDAYRLYLTDDPLISNYQTFKTKNLYITRSNDPDVYTGLNDIPSLGTVPTSRSVKNIGGDGSLSGDWLLVFAQALDREQLADHQKSRISLNLGPSWRPFVSESFSSYSDLTIKYPSIGPYSSLNSLVEAMPYYYGNTVLVTNDSYYTFTTARFVDDMYYMTWVIADIEYSNPLKLNWINKLSFDGYGATNPALSTVPYGYRFYNTSNKNIWTKSWKFGDTWTTALLGYFPNYGTTAARPVSPWDGYVYVNIVALQVQKYYSNNTWGSDPFHIVIDSNPSDYAVNVFPNQPVIIYALPIQTTIKDFSDTNLLSATAFKSLEWYNGTDWQSYNILSARIVNGSSIIKDSVINYNGPSVTIEKSSTEFPDTTPCPWSIGFLTSQITSFNVSYQSSAITNYTLREPFKTHELWIYGQKYDIPSFLVHNLYMRQSINSNGLNYMIYKDPDYKDLYISGTVSMEVQWNTDSLADWVAQNPTYKDQFNLRKQQQWAETLSNAKFGIVTGAVGGAVIPGVGTATGALMGAMKGLQGIATTKIREEFDKKNLELSLQSNRLLTDKLYGDTSSALQYWNIRHGIYWVVKTMNNENQMKLQYDTTGYPTNMITTILELSYINSTTLGVGSKLVYGYFNHTIVNAYVTQAINNKMKDGIILVE